MNNNTNSKQEFKPVLVTTKFLNGNNDGSILSNKRFLVSYCNIETKFETKFKTIIGCFINPADLALSYYYNDKQSDSTLVNTNIYYFQVVLPLNKMFNVEYLLKNVIWTSNYQNNIIKDILFTKYKDIIQYCEKTLKEKIFNY